MLLAACGGGSSDPVAEEARPQDSRNSFTVATASLPFAAMDGATVETDRWTGINAGAGYRIEVPKNWNGMLVMYAHGYAGEGNALTVSNPAFRRYLIDNGYAWAASSYTKNFYDVRVGVEDTNALANAFVRIAAANGRVLAEPSRVGLKKKAKAVIIATGSEVQLALAAQEMLAARKIPVRVVSMPSTTTFDRQDVKY